MDGPESPNASPNIAPIMWRVAGFAVGLALLAAAFGFLACARGANFIQMFVVMVCVFALGGIFLFRWYLAALRRIGYPLEGMFFFKATPSQWQVLALSLFVIIGAVVLVDVAYAASLDRFIEAFVATALQPLLFLLLRKGYALRAAPKPQEASMLRLGAMMQVLSTVIFLANLILQLNPRHHYADLETFRNAVIAMYFVIIPLSPIGGYFMWKRYREAQSSRGGPQLTMGT